MRSTRVDRPSLVDGARRGDGQAGPAARLLRPGQYRRRGAEGRLRDRRSAGAAVDAGAAAQLPIVGLMCVPPLDIEPAPYFALLAKLARRHDVAGLSMGMSGDYRDRGDARRDRMCASARRCSGSG